MRLLLPAMLFTLGLSAQPIGALPDAIREVIGQLDLEQYKTDIQGLTQFGDRRVGTDRNREAVDWLEQQLWGFGYSNVERNQFDSFYGPLDNLYATKIGTTHPDEMYIVSAHLDGRGGGEGADDDASGCAIVLELARILSSPNIQTSRSIRFIFFNADETRLNGSDRYVWRRLSLRGTPEEPKWLGVIQHDTVLFDHGLSPGLDQNPEADLDIEYQKDSHWAKESEELAASLMAANRLYAKDYSATVGEHMADTDSVPFEDWVAAVSIGENERESEIGAGSNPNFHRDTDTFDAYTDDDFRLGLSAAQTTLGALGHLAGIQISAPDAGSAPQAQSPAGYQ